MSDSDTDQGLLSLDADQYTVGWICALPQELQAARAMLDERHAKLKIQSRHDSNNYDLGRIGLHNVTMAILPHYGVNEAAVTASRMQSTFLELKFVLMVGIGGGVHSVDNDIRLGDLVISSPNDQGGGVIQYDLGKEESSWFRRIGTLNRPPNLLGTAVTSMRAEFELGKKIHKIVRKAISKTDGSETLWSHPGDSRDVIFRASYDHIRGQPDCKACIRKATARDRIQVENRGHDYPVIHYGNIGSGNTVMKNARKRDLIASAENVICFEMEAAGLMNEFPCLVIRGISDYADSHKSGNWQRYAAIVAAAYAKRLLRNVSSQAVRNEDRMKNACNLEEGITDVALPKLLLKYGDNVEFKEYLPLRLSFKLESTEIAELLIRHIRGDSAASAAFELARASTVLKPASRLKIYARLLRHNISKEYLNQALVDTVMDSQDVATIQFLLAQGANPNEDGANCFILACKAGSSIAFRAMCPYADVDAVARALLEHCTEENQVIKWLDMCLDTLVLPSARIKDPKLLYLAMLKFPNGRALVDMLLDYGLSAGTLLKDSLCKQWVEERVTLLLWALFSARDKKISNHTLLALVARGDDAKPLYCTPKSQVSAAFACMLDPARTPVLEALLKSNRDKITSSIIPGRSFSYLSQKPKKPDAADLMSRDLPLSDAALYLGNFKAYRALQCGEDADNGSLHTAALLALPEFVAWLLQWHSADHPHEEFDMMIPLAVACRSKARPWCRIANADATFEDRRKRTMRLLAKKTNLAWRNRRKTVLHFAIDSGPDALLAMLEALDVANDPKRDDRYLYTDREGIVYSLSCYISHLQNLENRKAESKAMIRSLRTTGRLNDRMYRPKPPGQGVEQPEGYCGMPADLQKQWNVYDHVYESKRKSESEF
ncbi:hypothetical protein NM208_g3986 [Fusarium decemcellulare]|uniref:Uncharacterized protein n=2 Tax=Fusarium decemcellulare TaxID=57161 RepID=A0ACC1SM61_9HYPO|nr:hypothetical protein NM208_g4163 [Fusarium decemcellulare]KAJ3542657.1 hypothetical protein NM208_g3986 [Fusarium decemcellulare]